MKQLSHYIRLTWILCFFAFVGLNAMGQDKQAEKTLLVINAYYEDEQWANSMSQPIAIMSHSYPEIFVESFYLNNSAISDILEYERMCDNLFKRYADNPPSYVVLLGNFSFTLRDRIKEHWGEDIPMLLIARSEMGGDLSEYLSGEGRVKEASSSKQFYFSSVRENYNMSAVIVPDFSEYTVDLMIDLIPDMKELVFASDKSYANKRAARDIHLHLVERYPNVKFRWIQADENSRKDFRDLLSTRTPDTGILVSSWVYEIENSRNMKILTTRELSFIPGSLNPVFALRSAYIDSGCIGGIFVDLEEIKENIISKVKMMIEGKSLKNEPFYIADQHNPIINYRHLLEYGLSPDKCPSNTRFIDKPETVWEKSRLLIIVILCVIVGALIFTVAYNEIYRRQIKILKGHEEFLNNMPLPYTRVSMWLEDTHVKSISYEQKNKAYDDVISRNGLPSNPLHLFTEDFLDKIKQHLQDDGKVLDLNYHFKHTDCYYHFIFIPVSSSRKRHGGDAYEIDVFAIDLTKDYKLEQKIKDQSVTIDIAMEMAGLVPWQWNVADRKISFFPNRNAHLAPADRDKMHSISFENYLSGVHPDDRQKLIDVYEGIANGKFSQFNVQYRVRDLNDSNIFNWFENHGAITDTDSEGKTLRVTGSIQNITTLKQQEEKMAQALLKASESDRLKSAFLANMSHEIRTPLNAIVGFSNLLVETEDVNSRKEYAHIINSNNEFLLSLINDILDLAKIESNTISVNYDVCDIHDLVNSVSKTVSIRVPDGVRLNVVHYSDSCIVSADASHVTQVLINLLTNATKFTRKGSITVGYEVHEDMGEIYFYVKDTGIGIKKENIDKIFQRFVKLNNFIPGTGLGLTICSTLVDKMGGEIGVESPGEGRGCTFWFTIPYNPCSLEEQTLAETPGSHNPKPPVFDTQTTMEVKKNPTQFDDLISQIPDGMSILVVEDNQSNFWLIDRLIRDKFTIHHAENGQIGVEKFKELHPDLIIMDINMPVMDGYDAVAEIRKLSKNVPIIAATAYAFPSDRIKILSSGFNAYVSKPISAAILYETIISVLNKNGVKKGGGNR